jgi:hypothetical protein
MIKLLTISLILLTTSCAHISMTEASVKGDEIEDGNTLSSSRSFNGAKNSVWTVVEGKPVRLKSEYNSTKVTDAFMTTVITGVKFYLNKQDSSSSAAPYPYDTEARDLLELTSDLRLKLDKALQARNLYDGLPANPATAKAAAKKVVDTANAAAKESYDTLKRELNRVKNEMASKKPVATAPPKP